MGSIQDGNDTAHRIYNRALMELLVKRKCLILMFITLQGTKWAYTKLVGNLNIKDSLHDVTGDIEKIMVW